MSIQCIRLLELSFLGNEIAIGIEIDAGGRMPCSNLGAYRKTIDIQFLVSKRHISSIPIAMPIAIPISIRIILTRGHGFRGSRLGTTGQTFRSRLNTPGAPVQRGEHPGIPAFQHPGPLLHLVLPIHGLEPVCVAVLDPALAGDLENPAVDIVEQVRVALAQGNADGLVGQVFRDRLK